MAGTRNSQEAPEAAERQALCADIYRLLASLVREAPSAALLGFLAALDADEEESELRHCWAALSLAASRTGPAELERAHFRHLIGVIQGELMPYASWYLTGSLMEMPLVELRRDLNRLGFERAVDVKEPEDHFSALCEVMAMLIDSDSPEQAAFFRRHLAPWALDFMTDLARVDTPFYAATGQLGRAFLQRQADVLVDAAEPVSEPRPEPKPEPIRMTTSDEGLAAHPPSPRRTP